MQLQQGRKYHNGAKLKCVWSVSALLMVLVFVCCANAQGKPPLAEAMGLLAEEKTLAESYASILKQFGKKDLKNYAQGIQLYAHAKAEFDGLIEKLKYNLKNNIPLDESADFKAELNQAAEQRVAFTKFVTEKIIDENPGSKNPLAIASIAAVPDLLKALTEVGNAIWKEYRGAKKEQQQAILDQLSEMKWEKFSDIAESG